MWIASTLETVKTPTVIALGNFDGVHRGHQSVIAPVVATARTLRETIKPPVEPVLAGVAAETAGEATGEAAGETTGETANGAGQAFLWATVVMFHPHPRAFFSGQSRPLLTPLQEKARLLAQMGIEQMVVIPFDQALASLSPVEFVEQILVGHLQAQQISVGQDFRFGRKRQGTIADLQEITAQYHIPVQVAPLYLQQGERISSSAIRQFLAQGEIDQANQLLGRAYGLTGLVVTGKQLGRTIGFPTANLELPPDKFLPRLGVYSVWVEIQADPNPLSPSAQANLLQPAVMNIGRRPTVAGERVTVEVHLLDWSGDLYGQTLTVQLHQFLRPEQKFSSLDALKQQIQQDCDRARATLSA
ncbi:MAG: bifunctional riboflavin kinase/FAD synthetase [Elainella sp.]